MGGKKLLVSVVGGHKSDVDTLKCAEDMGAVIAQEGAVLICGGLGGVMEAASKGAKGGRWTYYWDHPG